MEGNREEALIIAAKAGDIEAFEILISTYEKTIYTLCLKILRDSEEAYDAAQEVCIKVWKQLEHFEGSAKLSTWIYRITTNQCLDILRKNKKHHHTISLFQKGEKEKEEWVLEEERQKDEVDAALEHKILQEVLKLGLSEIKPDYQVIVVLRDLQEYSYEEIAAILDISLGTVKSRLSRARMALKKVLQQNKEPYKSFFRQKW